MQTESYRTLGTGLYLAGVLGRAGEVPLEALPEVGWDEAPLRLLQHQVVVRRALHVLVKLHLAVGTRRHAGCRVTSYLCITSQWGDVTSQGVGVTLHWCGVAVYGCGIADYKLRVVSSTNCSLRRERAWASAVASTRNIACNTVTFMNTKTVDMLTA